MNPETNVAPAIQSETRPLYWSVRRELWESRSIYIAPLVVAAIVLFANGINMAIRLPHKIRGLSALVPSRQGPAVYTQFCLAASVILFSGFIVAVFYCVGALNSERRDRSILFWKSLPISDRTTVLAKAIVPMAIVPLITYLVALATQYVMALLGTLILLGHRVSPFALWVHLPFFTLSLVMLYGLFAHVLWYAPIYCWLLLVSAWSRRATALWALLPVFAILFIERVAFGTSNFAWLLKYRLTGAMLEGFTVNATRVSIDSLSQLDPLRFFSSAGLWSGLVFAAICLAAAVRLRRNREPI
jgi:ABC-2 type transport system permease protein